MELLKRRRLFFLILFLFILFLASGHVTQAEFVQCQFTSCSGVPGFPDNYGECVGGSSSANCDNDGFCNLIGQTYCFVPNFGNFYCGEQNEVICNDPPPPPRQCNDGQDNDGDGPIDYPADPGCNNSNDDDEYNAPPVTEGSLSVNANNGGVDWCLDHGAGCGTGSGTKGGLPFNTYTISITGEPNNYSCSANPGSRQINAVNPDKSFDINCTPTGPPAPTVNVRCNTLNACTLTSGATATLTWTTTNATSCTASSNPTGGWSGSKGTSGTEVKTNQLVTRTYTLTCSGPGGSGADSVVVTVPNQVPAVSSVRLTEPDYCTTGPGGTVSWSYDDPGDTQSAYQVQADNNSAFGSPEYDSGKTLSSSNSISVPVGSLTWNVNYRVRVRAWDVADQQSAWTTMTLCTGTPGGNPSGCAANQQSWTSPQHQYPTGVNTFSWLPLKPAINQLTQFNIGSTQCFQNPPNTATACGDWDWTFGDGSGVNELSPAHAYTTGGNYMVTLKVTEQQAGYSCSASKTLNIVGPIPEWKEVFPR